MTEMGSDRYTNDEGRGLLEAVRWLRRIASHVNHICARMEKSYLVN